MKTLENIEVRQFFNVTPAATDIVRLERGADSVRANVSALVTGALGYTPAAIVNTDGDPGVTIFVGSIDPAVNYTPIDGDVWIQLP